MTTFARCLIRLAVLAAGLGVYAGILSILAGDSQDPNIGAGLIAMALLAAASGVWGLLDGRHHPFGVVAACWGAISLVLGTGWLVVLSVTGADASTSWQQALAADLSLLPMLAGQVWVPAIAGAAVGQAWRPASAAPPSR